MGSWSYAPKKDKPAEWTKPPYISWTSQRTKASSTNPATWSAFEQAAVLPRFDGVGFVLTNHDDYLASDLDHCRDAETGVIAPWAHAIAQDFASYWESSPSGTGLRCDARAASRHRQEEGEHRDP